MAHAFALRTRVRQARMCRSTKTNAVIGRIVYHRHHFFHACKALVRSAPGLDCMGKSTSTDDEKT